MRLTARKKALRIPYCVVWGDSEARGCSFSSKVPAPDRHSYRETCGKRVSALNGIEINGSLPLWHTVN